MEKRFVKLVLAVILIVSMSVIIGPASFARAAESIKASSNGYEYSIVSGQAVITGYTGTASVISIPSTIGGYPVTSIGILAFAECGSLTSVTVPNGVTSIGDYAFYECENLASITLPSSVSIIGNFAFGMCYSLRSLNLPSSLTTIGSLAFSGCASLTAITIPSGVKTIGAGAFSYCLSMTGFSVATANTAYASLNGVLYTKNLKTLIVYPPKRSASSFAVPSGVTRIEELAFGKCNLLQRVTIPSGVTVISPYAFWSCYALGSISIPSSVTTIGEGAFSECSNLISITIPSGVTSLGDYAFAWCDNLANIYTASTNPNYASSNGVLYNKSKKTLIAYPAGKRNGSFNIPSSVTAIGTGAFISCSLDEIKIPGSVASIGYAAFEDSPGLSRVLLQEGVKSIGNYAFASCLGLRSIIIPNSVTSIGNSAFRNNDYVHIFAHSGSYGHTYAKNRNIPFETLDVEPFSITSITLSKTVIPTNTLVTFTINTTGGVGGVGELQSCFYLYKDNTLIEKGIYNVANSYTFSPGSPGKYKVQAYVKDLLGTKVVKYSEEVTVSDPVIISGVTTSTTSTKAGESVTFTVNASGGTEPLAYRFDICNYSGTLVEGTYGSSNMFTYTFEDAGRYRVVAYVKDANGIEQSRESEEITVTAPLAITNIGVNWAGSVAGDFATFTINATGGTGTLNYCFYVYKDGVAIYKGQYSYSNIYTYTFPSAGKYKVQGYVRDAVNAKVSSYSDVIDVLNTKPLAFTSITADNTSVIEGGYVTFAINATGGRAPLSYCFYIYKDGVAVHKGLYSPYTNEYTHVFATPGTYKVQGYVKDGANAKLAKYGPVITVSPRPPLSIDSVMQAGNSSLVAGDNATFSIFTTGGKFPLSYCFYVYKNGTAIYKGSYGPIPDLTYTFQTLGSYKIQGYVKDAAGAKASKYSAAISVSSPPPLAISSVTASKTSLLAGDNATFTINATGGKAPYSYCFYVYKDGLAVYKGSYSSSNEFSCNFQLVGSYKVQGYVKDAANAKVSKYSSTISVDEP